MESINVAHDRAQSNKGPVKVYKFMIFSATGERFSSQIYATPERIERLHADMILSTAKEVDLSDLDDNGSYDPPQHESKIIYLLRNGWASAPGTLIHTIEHRDGNNGVAAYASSPSS